MTTFPKIKKCGNQMCYSWADNYGFHQYYCEITNEDVGNIVNFSKKENENYVLYSWNDNYGYHMYYADKIIKYNNTNITTPTIPIEN
jgi:hypothetical protein